MKTKIGIITFHRAINYGAVFQAYALQQFLKDNKIESEIINYICKNIEDCYKPFKVSGRKFLPAIVRGILFSDIMRRKKGEFRNFIQEHLTMSKECYSLEELKNIRDEYSAFIAGSDQVWGPTSAGFDEAYFLTFARDDQKNSYAASIGMDNIPLELVEEYKKRLKGFQKISVREKEAKNLISEYVDIDIEVHLDPTLLLNSERWRNISNKPEEEDYLVIFNVEKPICDIQFAKKIAEERKLKIIYINDRTIKKEKGIKYVMAPTPENFLGFLENAKVIITNSFHGTAFSIIFHKEFYVELNNKKRKNVRAEDLLALVDIQNRVIEDKKFNEVSSSPIDWTKVDQILNTKKQESENYLKSICIK